MSTPPSGNKRANRLAKLKKLVTALMPFLKPLGLTTACYLPAFGLIVLSFLLFVVFPTGAQRQNSSLSEKQKEEIEKIIAQEVSDLIDSKLDTALNNLQQEQEISASQEQSFSNETNSALLTGYINEKIQSQAQIEAEKAAVAKIEELKTNWTSDLFNQIAFAVIFTVASIFAAFAVKDVLTEVLKEQEKDRVKQDLKRDLQRSLHNEIVPNEVEARTQSITEHLQDIEDYTYWVEHELLNDRIIRMLDEFSTLELANTDADTERNVDTEYIYEKKHLTHLVTLIERSQNTLGRVSGKFKAFKIDELKKAEDKLLEIKIDDASLKNESKRQLLKKLKQELISDRPQEDIRERIDSIFEVQVALLITTLSKLKEDNSDTQLLISNLERYLRFDQRAYESMVREEAASEIPEMQNPFEQEFNEEQENN